MESGIDHLVAEGIISEVLARLKSGKEADVYVVRYGGRVVAAKVYKDRAHRSFKNNSAYKEGRAVRNSRDQRAMDKKSAFGQATAEDAWKTAEVDALYKLHGAGVRVPTPVMYLEGVLLMELCLTPEGDPAPRLIDMDLTAEQAAAGYRDMLTQLVRILCCDLIHGDLSPYNVLWSARGPTIIDFPQIVSAAHNSNSEMFFLRDARNILGYFAAANPSLNARSGDPGDIWRQYMRRQLSPDFVPAGRPAPPPAAMRGPPPRAPGPPAPRPPYQGVSRQPQRSDAHRGDPNRRPQGGPPYPNRSDANRGDPNRRPQGGPPFAQGGNGQNRNDGNRRPGGPQQNTHRNDAHRGDPNRRPQGGGAQQHPQRNDPNRSGGDANRRPQHHNDGPPRGGRRPPDAQRRAPVTEVFVRARRSDAGDPKKDTNED